jgi:hypothetical protein
MSPVGPIETSPGQAEVGEAAEAASAVTTMSPATDAANPTLCKEKEVIGVPPKECSGMPDELGSVISARRRQLSPNYHRSMRRRRAFDKTEMSLGHSRHL